MQYTKHSGAILPFVHHTTRNETNEPHQTNTFCTPAPLFLCPKGTDRDG